MTDDKIKNNISTQKPRLTSSVIVKYNNKYLLGQRNKANMKNKWVFPGGGVEFGETLTMAAIREVKEETGIVDLKIVDFRTKTYHIFKKNNEYCLKETTWYNMVSNFDGEFIPELKEDITKVVWKNDKKIKKIKNTFPNIKLLLSI